MQKSKEWKQRKGEKKDKLEGLSMWLADTLQAKLRQRLNLPEYGHQDCDICAKSLPEQFIASSQLWIRVQTIYFILPLTYVETDGKNCTANLSVSQSDLWHTYVQATHTQSPHSSCDNDGL